jgi:hypothetical protein
MYNSQIKWQQQFRRQELLSAQRANANDPEYANKRNISHHPFRTVSNLLCIGVEHNSVVPNISCYQLFFYGFAILTDVNGAMLTAG